MTLRDRRIGEPDGPSDDVMVSRRDPLLALTQGAPPQKLLEAWLYLAQTLPDTLRPHHSITLELNLCANCSGEQFAALRQSLGQILGFLAINPATIEQHGNTIILRARLFKDYQAAIITYLQNFLRTWLNSDDNTFLSSIRVEYEGDDPMEAIEAGRPLEFGAGPGYFESYSETLQRPLVIGKAAEAKPSAASPEPTPDQLAVTTGEKVTETVGWATALWRRLQRLKFKK